ncbi:hypothetical protein GTQ48_15295 [Alteromonas genovensis]|uniref:Transporter substrate-binding domain-containing protein n=1 Tax=Alteromonas genovensis TaxID=471225 RepID=A0A6N9TQG3_9ALTE|nr:ABC transporter substrate-binding protein [Alteromonas genovensis]NDW16878.1 hypothetical protein [Alteromonas genovensis]
MRFLFFIIFVLMFLLPCGASDSERIIDVSVYNVPGLLEKRSDDVPYSKLIKLITKQMPATTEFHFSHALRAVSRFNDRKSDCLFPGSKNLYQHSERVIESKPLYIARAYFFGLELLSADIILHPSAKKMRIGFRHGNTFGGKIETLSHHTLIPLQGGSEIHEMILRGRIDAFLDYIPDALPLLQLVKSEPLQYDDTSFFYEQNDSLLCHDSSELRRYIIQFNQQVDILEDSGVLQAILDSMDGVDKVP